MRNPIAVMVAVALLSAGCAAPGDAPPDADPPQAVILIVVDTLRPDHLSCYGYDRHRTANVDRLAAAGVLFGNAQAAASWTIPSMGSMLTSRYPTQLGMIETPGEPDHRFAWRDVRTMHSYAIPDEALTLAEVFRDAGWTTAAFVNQPGLNAKEGFQQGFDDWFYPVTAGEIGRYDPATPLEEKRWSPFLTNAALLDAGLAQEFDKWMAAHEGRPVFAWLHFLTPHTPYIPVPQYLPEGVTPQSATHQDAYDAEIRFLDDVIGHVLNVIEARVGLDSSLVVFTSDHGEAFGEHGMVGHGHSLHGE
ncbi:MAG TPA: sulfatase, partial [bacterium]|nr:sulfatase [bacterium]